MCILACAFPSLVLLTSNIRMLLFESLKQSRGVLVVGPFWNFNVVVVLFWVFLYSMRFFYFSIYGHLCRGNFSGFYLGNMSLVNITLCVGCALIRILIQSLIIGMSGRSMGCEGMYRLIMSSGVSDLLDILKTPRYDGTLLGVGIWKIFSMYQFIMLNSGHLYTIARFLECGSGPRPTSK